MRKAAAVLLLIWCGNAIAAAPLGPWFDRARNGHGIDIQRSGDTYLVNLYTFDETGEPEWFAAQGSLDAGGSEQPLLRFANVGDSQRPDVRAPNIGTLQLRFGITAAQAPCSDGTDRCAAGALAELSFSIGGQRSRWCIEPLLPASDAPERGMDGTWWGGPDDKRMGIDHLLPAASRRAALGESAVFLRCRWRTTLVARTDRRQRFRRCDALDLGSGLLQELPDGGADRTRWRPAGAVADHAAAAGGSGQSAVDGCGPCGGCGWHMEPADQAAADLRFVSDTAHCSDARGTAGWRCRYRRDHRLARYPVRRSAHGHTALARTAGRAQPSTRARRHRVRTRMPAGAGTGILRRRAAAHRRGLPELERVGT